jgi:hypothetical protein
MVRWTFFIIGLIVAFAALVWSLQAPNHAWLPALTLGASLWYFLTPEWGSDLLGEGRNMSFHWWEDSDAPEAWCVIFQARNRAAIWYRENHLPSWRVASMAVEYGLLLLMIMLAAAITLIPLSPTGEALIVAKLILAVMFLLGGALAIILLPKNRLNREKSSMVTIQDLGGPFVVLETIYRHCGSPCWYRLSWGSRLFLPGAGLLIKLFWGDWITAFDMIVAFGLAVCAIEIWRWLRLRWQDTTHPEKYSPCQFYPLAVLASQCAKMRDGGPKGTNVRG